MRGFWGWLGKNFLVLAKLGYLALGIVLIFTLAYILGYKFLGYQFWIIEPTARWEEGYLLGNDSANVLTFIFWLNRYFPKIPVWYPFQGGGISFTQGYPILAHLLVVLAHRLNGLDLIQSFRFLGFLSVPLTALGIYLFGWTRMRNQTVGLVAAIFYLLTPLSWVWLFDWGFFALALALPFFVFTFIFFDFYYASQKTRGKTVSFWFFLTVLGFGITTLTHVQVGMGLAVLMVIYVFLLSISSSSFSRLKKGFLTLIKVGGASFALLLFWLLPFYRYMRLANREGLLNLHPPYASPIVWQGILSFDKVLDPLYIAYRNFSVPILVWGLSIVGIVLAVKYSRKIVALGLVSWLGIINMGFRFPFAPLAKIFPPVAHFFSIRCLIATTIVFLPLVAAFALWGSMRLVFFFLRERLRAFFSSSLALILTVLLVVLFRNVSTGDEFHLNYGPNSINLDIRDIWEKRLDDPCFGTESNRPELCQIRRARAKINIQELLQECGQFKGEVSQMPFLCKTTQPTESMVDNFVDQCQRLTEDGLLLAPWCRARYQSLAEQLSPKNWQKFYLSKKGGPLGRDISLTEFQEKLPEIPGRIDLSPYFGLLIQNWNITSNISQLTLYTNQLSLIHEMWGQQQEVFYTQEEIKPEEVSELAQWFGIEYVVLDPTKDPFERYPSGLWEEVSKNQDLILLRFKKRERSLVSLGDKPVILVIGSFQKGAYTQVFRLGNKGALPYDQFLVVEGKEKIDDYSLEELEKFDLVFLHGYSYRNRSQAWEMLTGYVKEGGTLFIDTGWQYVSPEWETELAPEVLPVKKLEWTNFGKTGDFRLEDTKIGGEVAVEKFAPLVWGDAPWGVSAPVGDLRDWAKSILTVKSHPLIAGGQYGKGKVVWSGINLVAHAQDKKNEEEVRFLGNLLKWLAFEQEADSFDLEVERNHPDKVEFVLTESIPAGTSLYWREAFYPDWQARLITNDQLSTSNLKIYRGGPGLMLMRLPPLPAGARIVLEIRQPWFIWLAKAISLLTLVVLVVLFLEGFFWDGRLRKRLTKTWQASLRKKIVKPLTDFWEKDEEV